jgi:lipopolysaccharide/colanic/teichoic acid biosynthesis glycosyltransferase
LSRIAHEWRRGERSKKQSLLVLFDGLGSAPATHNHLIGLLSATFRETDVFGWFKTGSVFGVILVELGGSAIEEARDAISEKLRTRVFSKSESVTGDIRFSFHLLPPYDDDGAADGADAEVLETISKCLRQPHVVVTAVQRTVDVCGSLILLLALCPAMLAIALCIRMTSRGPALFRQSRAGLGGRPFNMCKFRTMVVGNDNAAHQDYVKRFIGGYAERQLDQGGQPVYKLTGDPRVTRLGRFLRRTSLDELPQLWNVLIGDMSLVGPRPPLHYEVECYELWHRRRIYEVKPGITGLWQVRGRSRCTFDEMIRLDLQHANPRSLGLYIRVLLETPRAVIHGNGAH